MKYNNLVDTSSISNVLLIDENVHDYNKFIDGINSDTFYIVYNNQTSWDDLNDLLNTKFNNGIKRLGLAFLGSSDVLFLENKSFFEEVNKINLINFIKKFNVENIDYLGCNTLQYDTWKEYYDIIESNTDVIVGASNDLTGNLKYGGDWEMENTNENVKNIYFNSTIDNYSHLLDTAEHTIVLMSDGTVYGTGYNRYGQLGLGLGNTNNQTILQPMINLPQGKTISQISCGWYHTIVLMSDGTVYACGRNNYGQLGLEEVNLYEDTLQPMTLPSGKTVSQISCGAQHTVVLMSDGTVYACGRNDNGQLGLDNTNYQTTLQPMTLPSGKTVSQISCGRYHTVVLMSDGTVYSCGDNNYGQLGLGLDNTIDQTILQPMTLPSGKTVSQISCGGFHTVVLMSDGTVYGTGYNNYDQLGLGNTDTQTILQPMINLPQGKTISQISCGYFHTVVLMSDGTVYACGDNFYGQLGLGLGNTTDQTTLQQMDLPAGKTVSQISCSYYHTVVLMSDGTVYTCGRNNYGQLGLDNTNDQYTLQPMDLPDDGEGITLTGVLLQSVILQEEIISANICFKRGTLIETDEGPKRIESINENDTINGKPVIAITKIMIKRNFLIKIEKDAFGKNKPYKPLYVSKTHKVEYEGKMYEAYKLLNRKTVKKVKYNGDLLYNVLLESYEIINANGLECESLDPKHKVAKIYMKMKMMNINEKKVLIKNFNES